jgi:hypothetical protein
MQRRVLVVPENALVEIKAANHLDGSGRQALWLIIGEKQRNRCGVGSWLGGVGSRLGRRA